MTVLSRTLVCLMLLASISVYQLSQSHRWDIRSVKVEGVLTQVSPQTIQQRLAPMVHGPLWQLNCRLIVDELEEITWLDKVSVQRRWPHTVLVRVSERQPVARFNQQGLIDNHGRLFFASVAATLDLPHLLGDQQDFAELLQHWQKMSKILGAVAVDIKQMSQQRHALEILTKNGPIIVLPRHRAIASLQRFVDSYPQLISGRSRRLARVDMRYRHGMAIKWEDRAITK